MGDRERNGLLCVENENREIFFVHRGFRPRENCIGSAFKESTKSINRRKI